MNKDMTVGSPAGILWRFTVPMLISTMFQQVYNIVDSIVVGKYVGVDALAAVGASYPITMIFMAVAMGCNIGCSVVISQFFGAKDYRNLKTSVSTSLISIIGVSAAFMVIGFVFCDAFLRLLGTPENIMGDSSIYLGIYVGGLLFLFVYNICTGIFTALGDSKTPLYFLIGSSLGNVVLDLLFVIQFHMGVAGVAWATFIAQGISSLLALTALLRRMHGMIVPKGYEKFSGAMLARISRIAIPSILQQSFVSVGNLFVQGLVNSFGSDVVAGYSAAIKLNTFTITSVATLGNGISNFTAQNIGAGKIDRVKKGLNVGIQMMLIVAIPFTLVYFFFGNTMMGIFMNTGDVAAREVGIMFLRIASPFYIVVSAKLICDGVLRGAGAMKCFMIATFSDLIIRVVLAFVFSGFFGAEGIWMSWPVGWIIGSAISVWFYKTGVWHRKLSES